MRFAFPAWQATVVRSACIVAVAVAMVGCDSSTSTNFANQLSIVGGDGQTVSVNAAAATPLTVLVVDSFGNPVPNATVTWLVTSGSGTIKPATTVTGATGQESATFTGGATAGDAVVNANVGGIYIVNFTEHVH
ncbi:MAG TPA: Ig-like domain-containing protein [Gemmatimonadaceae bacterium]|jgi:hypothetical protein